MTALPPLVSYVCGRVHVWSVGGQLLPLCERCTGLYAGAVCALAAWFLFRPRPTTTVLWVHGGALSLMIPFGYHLVPQNADLRTLTGYVFAFGLTYFFLLIPEPYLALAPNVRGGAISYAVTCAIGAVALMTTIHFGSVFAASALTWMELAGLVSLGTLVVVNLFLTFYSLRSSRVASQPAP